MLFQQTKGDGVSLDVARQPIRKRRLDLDGHDGARLQRGVERRRSDRLNSDYRHVGAKAVGGDADAADQAATPGGHHQRADVGRVFEDFERNRPATGDDRRVVVRRDEGEPALAREPQPFGFSFVVGWAALHELGARVAERLDLRLRSRFRNHDESGHAQQRSRSGDTQTMVARRRRDYFVRLQRQERIERAPQLERARGLEALELEPDLNPSPLRQPHRALERRPHHIPPNPLRRGPNVVERNHALGIVTACHLSLSAQSSEAAWPAGVASLTG